LSAFTIEEFDGRCEIVTRAAGNDGRVVMMQAPNMSAANDAMKAVRVAYNAGRRDEAAIRAAAFSGLLSGTPLHGGAV
jgi:hypothetical protein